MSSIAPAKYTQTRSEHMHTRLCEMFGIDVPIFAFSHCRDVVVEVSRAGGFGVLGGGLEPEALEIELRWIDEHIGGRPYGIDFLMPGRSASVEEALQGAPRDLLPPSHRAFLEDVLAESSIPPFSPQAAAEYQRSSLGRLKIRPDQHRDLLDVTFRHPVKLIASALGKPPPGLVERAHGHGARVAALVGSPEHAAKQRDAGVDFVIAQGNEAGGHTGHISTMVLVPQVVDCVTPMPVLAAGGIGNGRQMAAALALGAEGVWCGSVWLATAQSDIDPKIKQKIIGATSADAVITKAWSGKNNRILRSRWTDAWTRRDAPETLMMPMQGLMTKEVMHRANRAQSNDFLSHPAGQVIGQVHSETSVRQTVHDMLTEFADTMERMERMLR
jgi:NAD(P)H-dependent flavin oxidoreductase YrpB (nitropropane dioxygenase family)